MVATAGDSLKGASVYGRSLDGKRSELELALVQFLDIDWYVFQCESK